MLSELNSLKTDKLEEYLNGESIDDGYLYNILNLTLSRPEIIQVRNKNKRSERDVFINRLHSLICEIDIGLKYLVSSKIRVIKNSEVLFDKISKIIEECEISKKPRDIQVWSHIKRVESEFKILNNDIDAYKKHIKQKNVAVLPNIMIKNNKGDEFSADAASDNLISYLSITLHLLAHKFEWFKNDKVVLPDEKNVSEKEIFMAGSIELFARAWNDVTESSQRALLFGGEVVGANGDRVQEDAKKYGIKETYYYKREESDYEIFDALACERAKRVSLETLINIVSDPELIEKIPSDINSIGHLGDGHFINVGEISACMALSNVFCTDVQDDKSEYHGLTLFQWIRSYSSIQYLSEQIKKNDSSNILTKTEIIEFLIKTGIPENKASIFIDLITFSKGVKDIYDCPLIKLVDDRYYFAYYSCLNLSVPNVILSRFSSLETEASDKGPRFEERVKDHLSKKIGICKGFKFKRGEDEYEYDAVFILDRRIFVLECKNRSLSWYSPVKAYRNQKFLNDTVKQILRLKDALITYPEVIQEHFNVDISNYEVVPIIFNCMPFSWAGKYKEGVYISDFSSFSRLLRSSEIYTIKASRTGQQKKNTSYKQWKSSSLCSDDIINHLENPVQLAAYLKSRQPYNQWWLADVETAFNVVNYDVNISEYQKIERRLFSSEQISPRRKLTIDRKAMAKKSRKRNRKK